MKGKLYLVATPIGNLNDITLRAINILKEVDMIAAEDTRHTLKLLNKLEIKKPLISYYKENEKTKKDILIEEIVKGKNIALVSDAGTPAISDPGEEVVKEAIKNGIEVIPVPGPCALVNALICSGLDTKTFIFQGFLPTKNKEKREILEDLKADNRTIIFYEAPHKLKNTLQEILNIFGNRKIVLARELTKIHEEFIRGYLSKIIEEMEEPRGEYVVLVEGNEEKNDKLEFLNMLSLEEHYQYYERQGLQKKEIIKNIAKDRKNTKNEIYQYFMKK